MNKNNKAFNFLKRIKKDYIFRAYLITAMSLFITFVFACYNIYLGIIYNTSWNISIAIYYVFLLLIKLVVIINEKKLNKENLSSEAKSKKGAKFYLYQSIMLFIIDLLLMAPITFLVLQKKEIHYSQISAIATAAYTTYKIIMATKNFLKAKKLDNLSIKMIRNINLKDALVAILSLQYILIMTFDEGITGKMQIVCAISTFAVWTTLIVISIANLKNAIKKLQQTKI